jgi:radical SAM protein with 4Fe4S-binding SPASM domain
MVNMDFWHNPPKIFQWDSTSLCNLNCRHCRASVLDRKEPDLTFAQAADMLGQANELAPDAALALAGGEPMMRPDVRQILEFVKNHTTLSVEILTNATLITDDNIGWLTELVAGFNVSMEGATADIHDKVRGRGSFARTMAAVDKLVKREVPLAVRMTYFGQGEKEVENLMRMLHDHGVEAFNFRYVVPVGNASGSHLDPIQHERLSHYIWDLGKELNMTVGFSDPFPELLVNPGRRAEIENDNDVMCGVAVTGCSVAFSLMYINPQGLVQFCPYFPVNVDDVKKTPLRDIWYKNEKFNIFRYSRSFLNGRCGSCKYKFACGGCRGAAFAGGDYLGEEPRCWVGLSPNEPLAAPERAQVGDKV